MDRPTFRQIANLLDTVAPTALAESYDNVGLLVGQPDTLVTGIVTALDVTEEVIEEAIQVNANLIVAHHPVIFKGLKRLTGSHYAERFVMKAIKHDIGIIACHTNLDMVNGGVSTLLAHKLGLKQINVLQPQSNKLGHLTTFVPESAADQVLEALFAAGAGHIGNYANCSFITDGIGTFKPEDGANPAIGSVDQLETVTEKRIEVIYPLHAEVQIISALRQSHPYEEVAYYASELRNAWQDVGLGAIGQLAEPMSQTDFLHQVKHVLGTPTIKIAGEASMIKTVAVAGGTCSFLTSTAIAKKADCFITADLKYHEWFDAYGKILLVDVGHYESEQFTIELLAELISQKFPIIAVRLTNVNTNPVKYF